MGLHLEWGKKDGTGKGVKEEEGKVMVYGSGGGGGGGKREKEDVRG